MSTVVVDYADRDLKRKLPVYCFRCSNRIVQSDFVFRIPTNNNHGDDNGYLFYHYYFHLNCFSCLICHNPLRKGSLYGLGPGGRVYCEEHWWSIVRQQHRQQSLNNRIDQSINQNQQQSVCSSFVSNKEDDQTIRKRKKKAIEEPITINSQEEKQRSFACHRSDDHVYVTGTDDMLWKKISDEGNHQPSTSTSLLFSMKCGGDGLLWSFDDNGQTKATTTTNNQSCKEKEKGEDKDNKKQCSNTSNGGRASSTIQPLTKRTTTKSSRPKRIRTSFKRPQLDLLRQCFKRTHKPSFEEMDQLQRKTHLSKRVLQIWFQNQRSKWQRFVMSKPLLGPIKVQPGGHIDQLFSFDLIEKEFN